MISSERSQNVIVSFVIIAAIVSSVFLVSNAQFYSGSYVLAGRMEVSIVGSSVSNIDQTNSSIYPIIAFTFNFRTDSPIEGDVQLNYIGATLWLNDDLLSFTPLARYLDNNPDRFLHPGYDNNFTLALAMDSDTDRAAILEADSTDTWNWLIRLRYNFITFDEERSLIWRVLYFNWTGSTTTI